ncbi:MAG: hypothetical protein ACI89T_000084 [Cognaticolwellia sp.]|jgi:hypothetical protein
MGTNLIKLVLLLNYGNKIMFFKRNHLILLAVDNCYINQAEPKLFQFVLLF